MNDRAELAVLSAQLDHHVGDVAGNLERAQAIWAEAAALGADLAVFPELFLCGYPPEDLVQRPGLVAACAGALEQLRAAAKNGTGIVIGLPVERDGALYNAVALIGDGRVDIRFKHELPNRGVFDEKRLFAPGPLPEPVRFRGWQLGLPICEDLWSPLVAAELAGRGCELLLAANGSPWRLGKRRERLDALSHLQGLRLPLVWVNRVGGQDELVFDGASFALDREGGISQQSPAFEECLSLSVWRRGDGTECVRSERAALPEGEEETYRAVCLGLRDYMRRAGFGKAVLGLSGGIDSALAAAICADALGPENVLCTMLPWHHTGELSLGCARACAAALGIDYREIPIGPIMDGMEILLRDHDLTRGAEDEALGIAVQNMQSRARGMILMALSNALGRMLIATGNRSEIAMGYATLYGDMCGGFNPLKSLYKTEVYALARWRNRHRPRDALGPAGEVVPQATIDRAPSAELSPGQTDADALPPYDRLDDMLRALIERGADLDALLAAGHDTAEARAVIARLHASEYKRRQAPPGPRVGRADFGRDRRYPISHRWRER